jgi:hypothetical protein
MTRWSGPKLLCLFKNRLLKLANSKQRIRTVLMYGYAHVHKYRCDKVSCPITAWELDKTDVRWMVILSVKSVLEEGMRIFPNSNELKLEYVALLVDYFTYEEALKWLIGFEYDTFDYLQKVAFQVLMQEVRAKAKASSLDQLNMVVELDQEERYDRLKQLLEESTISNLNFWSLVAEEKSDPYKLGLLAFRRETENKRVQELYQEISRYGVKRKVSYSYHNYM